MSEECSYRRHPAIRERISGGNLLTGCSAFRKGGINLRTSRAAMSRLSICAARPTGVSHCDIHRSEDRLKCIHLRSQRDGENRAGGGVTYPGVFQAEILV